MAEDTLSFGKDIFSWNENAVIFKTSHFLKRNFGRLVTVLDYLGHKSYVIGVAIKHGVIHTIHGFKALFKDGKWAVKTKGKSFQRKYGQESYKKTVKIA